MAISYKTKVTTFNIVYGLLMFILGMLLVHGFITCVEYLIDKRFEGAARFFVACVGWFIYDPVRQRLSGREEYFTGK